jgi:hypothetical protein
MIKLHYDHELNMVIIEFVGSVDAAQGEQYLPDIPKIIPNTKKALHS